MNIDDLLASPEGKTLEFKRNLSSPKPVLRTLVAFANTAGGTLVVGRTDDQFAVPGLELCIFAVPGLELCIRRCDEN